MKRRGFTLIELMVVIAIIIILAAIAIPNYLSMTARAKRSRVASDFAALATALETYRTDWNTYPEFAVGSIITMGTPVALTPDGVGEELTGTGSLNNKEGGTPTAAGDSPPIEYMTTSVLKSMTNPYFTGTEATDNQYQYTGVAADGTTTPPTPTSWTLTAKTNDAKGTVLTRTNDTPTLADASGT
jgi:prepilin-type N-terminal cleavage/methylation domain-containing protein